MHKAKGTIHMEIAFLLAKIARSWLAKRPIKEGTFFASKVNLPWSVTTPIHAIHTLELPFITYLQMCWPEQRPKPWPKEQGERGFGASWCLDCKVLLVHKENGNRCRHSSLPNGLSAVERSRFNHRK